MTAPVPASPTAKSAGNTGYQPHEIDPDLAAAHLVEDMMARFGTPGIVSKAFVVWYGIWNGLNHVDDTNPTYYDCSLRNSIYRGVFHNSVNVNGSLFERYWQYMMKPKMVVQGLPGQTTFEDEKKGGIINWIKSKFGGGGEKTNGNQ